MASRIEIEYNIQDVVKEGEDVLCLGCSWSPLTAIATSYTHNYIMYAEIEIEKTEWKDVESIEWEDINGK